MTGVLIVEDERIVARDIQQTLQAFGYDAYAIASSGDEALQRAAARRPDVVLMDIRIKGSTDGVETADTLRKQFGVPVVYLTAHADDATIDRAKQTKPFGYLVKPVRSDALKSAIEIALYQHEMEQRSRERERWYATTLGAIGDGVLCVDADGRVSFVNAAAEQIIGAPADALLARDAHDVFQIVDADRTPVTPSPLDRALAERRVVAVREMRLLGGDDRLRFIGDSVAPVIDDGRLLGAIMVFRDETEERDLRTQLERSERLASLGTMAAGVAHEVNNPLAVVAGNASVLRNRLRAHAASLRAAGVDSPELSAEIAEMEASLADVDAAASRIGRIVADLRAFSRPAEGPAHADPARVIAWALRSTAHELRHRAVVRTSLAPAPLVAIDETRLGQVLVNLLVNAAHAIDPGDVERNEVSVTMIAHGAQVEIEVRDTGAGIPAAVLGRIFDPFFSTKGEQGMGLGLAICHRIVTSAGGTLDVASELGKGTSFWISLRAFDPAALDAPPREPTPLPPARPPIRILAIDDEPMLLRVFADLFKGDDFTGVQSAVTALERIRRDAPFDVVLCDLTMPQMSGVAFYEALLAEDPETARRVVFVTGGALTATAARFLATTTNRTLEKPFSEAALRAAVDGVIEELARRERPLEA